jgi:exosome complex RNA-binding protein Csl4
MIDNPGIGNLKNLLTLIKPPDKGLSLKAGTIIKAQVIDVTGKGEGVLRLAAAGGEKGAVIKAQSDVPLVKGQNVFLEIMGGKNNIAMRLIGMQGSSPAAQMTNSSAAETAGYMLTVINPRGKGLPFKSGDVVRAQVLEVSGKGESVLRLAAAGGGKGVTVKVLSDAPLAKGQNVFLEIMGGKNNATMRLIGSAGNTRAGHVAGTLGKGIDGNRLTVISLPEKGLPFKAGAVIRAQVLEVVGKGEAVLRMTAGGGKEVNVKVHSDVSLAKGQNLVLEVAGGKTNVAMRILGSQGSAPEAFQQNVPVKLLDMLAKLSDMRAGNSEFQQLVSMLRSLPPNVKNAIPGMKKLHTLLMNIKQIDGKVLKAFVENSGVAFETRLRVAALSDSGSVFQNLMALQAEGDLKAILLRLRSLLKDQNIIYALKQSGLTVSDVSGPVERFIAFSGRPCDAKRLSRRCFCDCIRSLTSCFSAKNERKKDLSIIVTDTESFPRDLISRLISQVYDSLFCPLFFLNSSSPSLKSSHTRGRNV